MTTYDGTLLPGLFDAHVHLVSDAGLGSLERAGTMSDVEVDAVIAQSLGQQVAAGVTTVRDLRTDPRALSRPVTVVVRGVEAHRPPGG